MSTLIGSTEAASTLGVSKATLYAYVSRGRISRRTAIDGRTSLYDRDEIERLAARSHGRSPAERPSIDVRIATGVTVLDDDSPSYRGHRLVDLATSSTFEQVAELLMTGALPPEPVRWRLDRDALRRTTHAMSTADHLSPLRRLALACTMLDDRQDDDRRDGAGNDADPADVGRRSIALAPSVLGGPGRGSVSERLARAWLRRPGDEVVVAIERALVLLADHELATSTLAVRVAASVRASPADAIATGLHAVAGRLHGGASEAAARLFDDAAATSPAAAIAAHLDAGRRVPGFGHTVYRQGDPRFEPLIDAVRAVPGVPERLATVDAVVAEAGRSVSHLPNIDLALGALHHVADLPRDAPLFAVARIAGWTAHYLEEIDERPVRFRGLARAR